MLFIPSLWLLILLAFSHALWPQPKHYEHGSSILWLSPKVTLVLISSAPSSQPFDRVWITLQQLISKSKDGTATIERIDPSEASLKSAFERTKKVVLERGFVPRKFHPQNASFEPRADDMKSYIMEVTIRLTTQDTPDNESYTLNIDKDGKTSIEVASAVGGLHALQTFSQLFFAHSSANPEPYTPLAPIWIQDSPMFEHRGFNLDIARNWIPPADVMRTIEAMSANKLNRLHIHASDAQSWPLEIPALPQLAAQGAYSPGQIWTTRDLEAVQRYGTNHGVAVFIEIDLPGHTTSIGNAYPHLITAKDEPWAEYAREPPSGQLRLNSSEVQQFIDILLNDLLPRTAQHSSYFHLGGDELNLNAYSIDPTVRSTSREVLRPLVQSLIDQVISLANSYSLTTILWEEMLLDWNLTLPKNIVIQTWRGNQDGALASILDKGHKTLFGSNSHWYLDCGHGTFLDPEPSHTDTPVKSPYLGYCSPYKNWRHMYAYNPLDGIPAHQRHLILGGEVHLWGELTDSVNLDSMLWPRVAAAAEVLWTGSGRKPDEDTTRRLADMRERLVMGGVAAGPVQMEWCLRHKGGCTL